MWFVLKDNSRHFSLVYSVHCLMFSTCTYVIHFTQSFYSFYWVWQMPNCMLSVALGSNANIKLWNPNWRKLENDCMTRQEYVNILGHEKYTQVGSLEMSVQKVWVRGAGVPTCPPWFMALHSVAKSE